MKGIAGMTGFLKQINVPAPAFFAWVVALLETVGAVLLILGLGTRILAVGFAIDMLLAIFLARIRMMKSPFAGGGGIGWGFEFILMAGGVGAVFTWATSYLVHLEHSTL